MKVIVHFEEEGPNIQTVIEELLLDCCCSAQIKFERRDIFETRDER